jgi:hypothetical protein
MLLMLIHQQEWSQMEKEYHKTNLLAQIHSSPPHPAIIATTLTASADATAKGCTKAGLERKLFEPMTILSYTTASQVTDDCAINLDQAALKEALALKDDAAFEAAKKIYKMGG